MVQDVCYYDPPQTDLSKVSSDTRLFLTEFYKNICQRTTFRAFLTCESGS